MKFDKMDKETQERFEVFLHKTNGVEQKAINFVLFNQHVEDYTLFHAKIKALYFFGIINTAFTIGWIISRFI